MYCLTEGSPGTLNYVLSSTELGLPHFLGFLQAVSFMSICILSTLTFLFIRKYTELHLSYPHFEGFYVQSKNKFWKDESTLSPPFSLIHVIIPFHCLILQVDFIFLWLASIHTNMYDFIEIPFSRDNWRTLWNSLPKRVGPSIRRKPT